METPSKGRGTDLRTGEGQVLRVPAFQDEGFDPLPHNNKGTYRFISGQFNFLHVNNPSPEKVISLN